VTQRLAGCVAISDRLRDEKKAPTLPATKLRAAVDKLPAALKRDGINQLTAARTREHAERIVRAASAADGYAKHINAELVRREVDAHALEWTSLRCKTLLFDAEGPAREAALLVREDGLTMAKAGAVAQTRVRTSDLVIEDVGGPLRDRLLAAQAGDLIGPVEVADGFLVATLEQRVPPSVTDPVVRERARERIVARAVQTEVDRRIRWHERF
jgi:hypothetical protein